MELDRTDASTWPELLTVDEAAHVLRMTHKHVRTLLGTGGIIGHKIGGRWYVPKAPLLTGTPPDTDSRADTHGACNEEDRSAGRCPCESD